MGFEEADGQEENSGNRKTNMNIAFSPAAKPAETPTPVSKARYAARQTGHFGIMSQAAIGRMADRVPAATRFRQHPALTASPFLHSKRPLSFADWS